MSKLPTYEELIIVVSQLQQRVTELEGLPSVLQQLRKKNELLEKKSIPNKTIKSRQLTVVQAMDEVAQVMAIPVKVRKETIWVRTDIPPNAASLMKAIGMRIPAKIIAN